MRSIAEARIRRQRAVELAAEGKTYDEIARAVGFSHRGSAHRAVSKALDEHLAANVDELRRLENDRLDYMLSKIWPRIERGDLDAISTALRISNTRMRLYGLTSRRAQVGIDDRPAYLVVGPQEGSPSSATINDVYHWSAAADSNRSAACQPAPDRLLG